MKLPSLPGPADLFSAAEGLRDLVTQSLALVPRVVTAVGQGELLLDRVSVLLARVEAVVDRAEDAVAGIEGTRARADLAIAGVTATRAAADEAVAGVVATKRTADAAVAGIETTRASADALLTEATGLLGRATPLLDTYQPALEQLAPLLRTFADDLDPAEIAALVTLVDRLPVLMRHLDEDVLPVVASMGDLAPDVHQLLDTVQDLRELAKGFPGSKLFRRRGAEEIAEEEAGQRGR